MHPYSLQIRRSLFNKFHSGRFRYHASEKDIFNLQIEKSTDLLQINSHTYQSEFRSRLNY